MNVNLSRRQFLQAGSAVAAASIVMPQMLLADDKIVPGPSDVFKRFRTPQWFKDAKFGLWLHWGPQSIPAQGAGWYARHMYEKNSDPKFVGRLAWPYHRMAFGHQADFGYKDICNLWHAEKFDAEATISQFQKWGARYVAIIANHHDNYDLFNSTVHKWNSLNVGPKRDIVGEFSAAARRHGLPWAATVHTARAQGFMSTAFGHDPDGFRKDDIYDGRLTAADGRGKWWDGLDPQQLYATHYAPFADEVRQRHIELVENYRPDMLYFDDNKIADPMKDACIRLYENSLKANGSIEAIVTVKGPQEGTLLDFEMGIADGMPAEYWQTDTSMHKDWFLKTEENTELLQNARTLKELIVDIVSKRGSLLLNLAVNADGSIPDNQFAIMEEFGAWLNANGEAIYATEPWKIYGKGGIAEGGKFKERRVNSQPWDESVHRFTCNHDKKTLYVSVFGNPAGKTMTFDSLADRSLFKGRVRKVSLVGSHTEVKWKMQPQGLEVVMPARLGFETCNVLRVETTGLW